MGLFDKVRKNSAQIPSSWKAFTEAEQFDEIIKASYNKPQAIFKHSVSCGISASVKSDLELAQEKIAAFADVHYLDLINYRAVSNLVSERTNVIHQSPQIIIIENGKVSLSSSHFSITPALIQKHFK